MRAEAVLRWEHHGVLNRAGTGALPQILPIRVCAVQFVTWNSVCYNDYRDNFQTEIINRGYNSRPLPED